MLRKTTKISMGVALAGFAAIQLFQPALTNPPSDPSSSFESVMSPLPPVSAALHRACRDCHSHETSWPWYSHVAPASWLISRDVAEGRAHLNLSAWKLYSPRMAESRIEDMCEVVREAKMPPRQYTVLHSNARFTPDEVVQLCQLAPDVEENAER